MRWLSCQALDHVSRKAGMSKNLILVRCELTHQQGQTQGRKAPGGWYNHGVHLGDVTGDLLGHHRAAHDSEECARLGTCSRQARDLEVDSRRLSESSSDKFSHTQRGCGHAKKKSYILWIGQRDCEPQEACVAHFERLPSQSTTKEET